MKRFNCLRMASVLLWLAAACGASTEAPSAATQGASARAGANAALSGSGSAAAVLAGRGSAAATTPITPPNPATGSVVIPTQAGNAAPAPTAPVPQAGSAPPPPAAPPKPPVTPPAPTMAPPPPPAAAPGPDDGDPSKPMVALQEVACRPANAVVLGLGAANFKVDDRDVIIDYPCNKHEGAPMTFILNLHGTTPVNLHFYQEGYFSAYKYVGTHNLIIATPSSVVEQWGNGDNGADLPYLMHVIDWVYKTLGTKFDIRSMWVGGHSWGAMYTAQFACKPEVADKVRGAIIMSGSPQMPACASKISVIDTNAEMDIGPPLNQGNTPMQHGCQASTMAMLGNNTQTLWPGCMKGFVHSNYLMLGKMHTDPMDDVVVKSIVDLIVQARP